MAMGGAVVLTIIEVNLQQPMQSVPITTSIVSSNPELPWYSWNIVESDIKHHKPTNQQTWQSGFLYD